MEVVKMREQDDDINVDGEDKSSTILDDSGLTKSPPDHAGVRSLLKFSIQNILEAAGASSTAAAVAAAACAARRSTELLASKPDAADDTPVPGIQDAQPKSPIQGSTNALPLW